MANSDISSVPQLNLMVTTMHVVEFQHHLMDSKTSSGLTYCGVPYWSHTRWGLGSSPRWHRTGQTDMCGQSPPGRPGSAAPGLIWSNGWEEEPLVASLSLTTATVLRVSFCQNSSDKSLLLHCSNWACKSSETQQIKSTLLNFVPTFQRFCQA